MSSWIDKEELLNFRREAYVTSVENKMENSNVVGVFGKLPLEIFYGYSLIPMPLEDIDSHIFKFGHEVNVCDVIRSTLIYFKTDKCPILFSCDMFVFSSFCNKFYEKLKEVCQNEALEKCVCKKGVYQYISEEKLKEEIEKVYKKSFSEKLYNEAKEKLSYIEKVNEKIDKYSNLSCEEAFLIRYFTSYLLLDDRVLYYKNLENKLKNTNSFSDIENEVVRFNAVCPRGGYKKALEYINKIESNNNLDETSKSNLKKEISKKKVYRLYFSNEDLDFAYENCIYEIEKNKNKYKINIMYEV